MDNPLVRVSLLRHYRALARVGLPMFILSAGMTVVDAQGEDLKIQARLITGTSKPQPNKNKASASIHKKLAGVFKWMHYYQVRRTRLTVVEGKSSKSVLSKDATILVQNLSKNVVEVKLQLNGKILVRKKQTLKSGNFMVLAGNKGSESAWFIVISKIQ